MKSVYAMFVLFVLIAGLLSACGAPSTNTPASTPSASVVPATEAPTNLPPSTDTAASTEPAPATEALATQPAGQSAEGATVSFAKDILPIIESRCANCHGGNRTEKGLVLLTHADIVTGSENGPVVLPGDAANSLLVELVATQKMPKRGPKLTPPQIQLFTDWVNQGALDN